MRLTDLTDVVARVRATARKTEKVALIADLLGRARGREIELVALYLTGRLPQGRVGVGWRAVEDAMPQAPSAGEGPTLTEVEEGLNEVARERGAGSAGRRRESLRRLLERTDGAGRRFLAQLLMGEVRQGALDGLVRDAIARAAHLPPGSVREAGMFAEDLGQLARVALTEGAGGLDRFSLRVLSPVAPMLASPADDVEAALERLGEAAFEEKVDGARVQVHRAGAEVRVFTRQLLDVTDRVPELVEWAQSLPIREFVVEGEALALRDDGRPHPFQVTMRRFGRSKNVAEARRSLPLSAFYFDCLHIEGEGTLVALPYVKRIEQLTRVASVERQLARVVTSDILEAQRFLKRVLDAGHEGAMAKSLTAPYVAGQRGSHWLKLKSATTLDLLVLAAEWGSGRRKGWLSNLHLGARDAVSGQPVMLGKTFKGLTDDMLRWQTEKLLSLETGRDQWTVHVRPELVVEVAFSDVQESPRYPAGLALRFARVKRHRPDKAPGDADSLQTVRALFEQQRA
jgi:DNA ligase-1